MLYPAPAVNPTPKLVNLAVGFTGTTTGTAMLVLSLLFSSKSYSWALNKVEPQTITSIVPRVAIQIDFIGPTPNPGLQSVFGVAAALEAYGRWLGAACHTVTFCSEEGF
jgi:hypothetical protein